MKESDLMHEAVIVDVVRTPAGRRNGKLKDWHPTDLGAHVLKALQERNDLDPSIVDDVVTVSNDEICAAVRDWYVGIGARTA